MCLPPRLFFPILSSSYLVPVNLNPNAAAYNNICVSTVCPFPVSPSQWPFAQSSSIKNHFSWFGDSGSKCSIWRKRLKLKSGVWWSPTFMNTVLEWHIEPSHCCNIGCPHIFGYIMHPSLGSVWIKFSFITVNIILWVALVRTTLLIWSSLNHCQHSVNQAADSEKNHPKKLVQFSKKIQCCLPKDFERSTLDFLLFKQVKSTV